MPANFTEVVTDVLVVGSGSAGSMAAIRAHSAGADTLVVTKGPWPSGNSTKALAGYAAAFGHADPRDNPDVHFADVVRNGIGLCNQRLVRKWVDSICGLTEEMRGWGLDLIRNGDKYHQIPWEGHTYPRMVCHHRVTGKYLMKCLGEQSERLGVKAMSHTIVGGIFLSDGHASGAWALNYRTGELYLIRAKSIILCTGGLGAMYPIGDNVGAVSAELTGMEFGHFLAAPIYPARMQVKFVFIGFVNGLLNEAGARLYNGRGERFMRRYDPERGELKHSSEELSRRIAQEIVEGRAGTHGGVYFDATDVPDAFRSNDRYQRMFELAQRAGLDLRREPIELATYPHDLVGGIKIDEFGRTNVPGLYAAGEAAGGSHGASRFGGSALSDCLVYGSASGKDAAEHTRRFRRHLPIDRNALTAAKDKIERWDREQGCDPGGVLAELSRMAFQHLNMVRSEAGLRAVLDSVQDIRANALPKLAAGGDVKTRAGKLREAIEAEGQSTLCELIAHAALERKESRGGFFGGHYRTEYPERDDANWLKTITLRKERGETKISNEPPVTVEELSREILDVMATAWRPPDDDPAHWSEAE